MSHTQRSVACGDELRAQIPRSPGSPSETASEALGRGSLIVCPRIRAAGTSKFFLFGRPLRTWTRAQVLLSFFLTRSTGESMHGSSRRSCRQASEVRLPIRGEDIRTSWQPFRIPSTGLTT